MKSPNWRALSSPSRPASSSSATMNRRPASSLHSSMTKPFSTSSKDHELPQTLRSIQGPPRDAQIVRHGVFAPLEVREKRDKRDKSSRPLHWSQTSARPVGHRCFPSRTQPSRVRPGSATRRRPPRMSDAHRIGRGGHFWSALPARYQAPSESGLRPGFQERYRR